MSATIEANGHLTNGEASLDDSEWLKTLSFRKSAGSRFIRAANAGDRETFQEWLASSLSLTTDLKKKERTKLREQLEILWGSQTTDWSQPLFQGFGKKSQQSAIVCQLIESESSESQSLVAALWTLGLRTDELNSELLFDVWRWVVHQGQNWLESRPICDPQQGLAQLKFLEACYMLAVTLQHLKGSQKLLKETTGLLRSCLDEATDTDGTPAPQWLPTIVDSLACLGRLTLFADSAGKKLWNKDSTERLQGLFGRTLSMCSRNHIAFLGSENCDKIEDEFERLRVVGETLGVSSRDGLMKLLDGWVKRKPVAKKSNRWLLPEESYQSDWAMLASLRSQWTSPVDQCVVSHDGTMPRLDVVVADQPLFSGAWQHELRVNDKIVEDQGDWSCTCWFSDDEVNFIELIQEVDSSTKVIRQIILLRDDQQLVLNHAVHSERSKKISYRSIIPLASTWNWEEDSGHREAALQSFDQRVRVIPLSNPQDRVTKANGSQQATETQFVVKQHANASRLFASTVLDWSPKRLHKPVDWSHLTVAQDGRLETADQAVGYRYRIGRSQWLLYHSLVEPEIPRTVLGMHSEYETVLGRFNSKGDIEEIVEVEL